MVDEFLKHERGYYPIMEANEEKSTDHESNLEEHENNEEIRRRIRSTKRGRTTSPKTSPCSPRIDILATPNRRLILDLYQQHAYHLSREKVEKLKELLQELYAMTPEETKRYFAELEEENMKKIRRKRIKDMLRKQYLKQKRQHDIAKAYRVFANILEKGI